MLKLLTSITLCFIPLLQVIAQERMYVDFDPETGEFNLDGTDYIVSLEESDCIGPTQEIEVFIQQGDLFTIAHVVDEMENAIGIQIFDKKGNEISIEAVQTERAKFFTPYRCCVYVEELEGKLYFIDPTILTGDLDHPAFEDYNCSDDSQTSDILLNIPRYYILNPINGVVKTIILRNKCADLIQNGEISCE